MSKGSWRHGRSPMPVAKWRGCFGAANEFQYPETHGWNGSWKMDDLVKVKKVGVLHTFFSSTSDDFLHLGVFSDWNWPLADRGFVEATLRRSPDGHRWMEIALDRSESSLSLEDEPFQSIHLSPNGCTLEISHVVPTDGVGEDGCGGNHREISWWLL